jgi:hypothetical protein
MSILNDIAWATEDMPTLDECDACALLQKDDCEN